MNSGQEVVVSDLNISSKEQQMKNRFFSNTRLDPPAKSSVPVSNPDPAFTEFLQDLQATLKQQPPGGLQQDLIKQQASIMEQQVELLKQEQKSFSKVVQHMSRTSMEDPKRILAEMLAPLNKQIMEVKSFYEETKGTAKEISIQVNGLKKALDENRASGNLRKSVEDGMNKFTMKKNQFDLKVKQAENMVSSVMAEAEENQTLTNCKQGIEYLREQILAVHKDAEKIELEMQARFKRIVEQAQKVKSIPENLTKVSNFEGSEARIEKVLGGKLDYDEILSEVNEISNRKNQIIMEYKKMTPVYPKFIKPVVVQVAEKKTVTKKPAQLLPVPVSGVRKTGKIQPDGFKGITNQVKQNAKPAEKRELSRASSDKSPIVSETRKKLQAKPEERNQREEINYTEESPKKELKSKNVKTENIERNTVEENIDDFAPCSIPRPPSPEAFKTRPGVTKGEQTKQITIEQIFPNLKNIETQEPPKPSLIEKTVDAATEFILNKILQTEKQIIKPSEPKATKWLGTEEISELTRLGLYFDPLTIERIGKQVLEQEIGSLKYRQKLIDINREKERLQEKENEEFKEIEVEGSNKEKSEYEDDFEENSEGKQENMLFDKISPKTPPLLYQDRFKVPEIPEKSPAIPESIPSENNMQSLLDPRLLGRMSAASIQHYISALIESGHLAAHHGTPSFLSRSRSPTPKTQPITTPQYKHTSDTTIIEQKLPEEAKDFFTSPVGSQIISTLKDNPGLSAQQVMETWAKKQGLSLNYPPRHELVHGKTEAEVFGRVESRGAKIFDIDEEEKKIVEESMSVRKVFQIPVLEIQRKSHSSHEEWIVTDSEVSALSQSGSVGSEVFNIENPEFFGGFMEYVRKARELEVGQVPGNSDLSEGEVRMEEESMSSGEIPRSMLRNQFLVSEKNEKIRLSGSGVLSEEDFEVSEEEGEFDARAIFKVE